MRITDIIRNIIDIIDHAEEQEAVPAVAIEIQPEEQPHDEVALMKQLAGLQAGQEIVAQAEYANEPAEAVAPIGAAFPAGDDMHHSKNPADIRTNAPSMYPGYQAEKR